MLIVFTSINSRFNNHFSLFFTSNEFTLQSIDPKVILACPQNDQKISQKHKITTNTFLRNTTSKLYNVVSAPVTATRDVLAERLQSVRDTTSL